MPVAKTKGSTGTSGMDAELYRITLCSKYFKAEGKVLRKEIAIFTRNLLKIAYHPSLLSYTSFDKIPETRPIGVCEVIRRVDEKTVLITAPHIDFNHHTWYAHGAGENSTESS